MSHTTNLQRRDFLKKSAAGANFEAVRKAIRDGVVGELQEVSAWGNRQLRRPAYLPAKGEPPKNLHYDLWIGPSAFHPYNPGYFDYAGKLIETMLLGLVAYRVGERIDYDGATGKSSNAKANQLMGKKYRAGWPLVG